MPEDYKSNSDIDFSKIDLSIKNLVMTIADISKKNGNMDFSFQQPQTKPKKPIKKLNIDLIKKVLMETKEIQEKRKNKNK